MANKRIISVIKDGVYKEVDFKVLKKGDRFKLTDVNEEGKLLSDAVEKESFIFTAVSDLFLNSDGTLSINTEVHKEEENG